MADSRVHSRDVQHIRADLASSLYFALGRDRSMADTVTAMAIAASVNSFDDSQQCLLDVLDTFGPTVFGHVTLFHLHNKTSLMGQSELLSHPRELVKSGLVLRDLARPASELKDQFADDAVEMPGLVERLEVCSAAYREVIGA